MLIDLHTISGMVAEHLGERAEHYNIPAAADEIVRRCGYVNSLGEIDSEVLAGILRAHASWNASWER